MEAIAFLVWDARPVEPPAHTAVSPPPPADPTRFSAAAEEVARLTSKLLLEPVDLASVVEAVVDLLAPRIQTTGVALCVQSSEVAPPPIVADRALLRQALLSLFSYALDQAPGGGQVRVICSFQGDEMALRLSTRCRDLQGTTRA